MKEAHSNPTPQADTIGGDNGEKRRKRLISESKKKGGYLWTPSDLHNALSWFEPTTDDDTSTSSRGGGGKATSIQVLCNLLSCPGIIHPRPQQTKKRKSNESTPLLPQIMREYVSRSNNGTVQDLNRTLSSIIGVRALTSELFQYYERKQHGNKSESSSTSSGDDCDSTTYTYRYFLNPHTIVKMSYAAQFHDQLVSMSTTDDPERKRQELLIKFTQLSKFDTRILEVLVLLLVEPLRRQTVVQEEEIGIIHVSPMRWLEKLLQSTNEQDCDYYAVSIDESLCRSIIDLQKANHNEQILFHNIPSSLLCFTSKYYFSMAKSYLEYLIKWGIQSYADIPSFMAGEVPVRVCAHDDYDCENKNKNNNKSTIEERSCNNDLGQQFAMEQHQFAIETKKPQPPHEAFISCIERLRQFIDTSKSQHSLYQHVLEEMKTEAKKDKLTLSSLQEIENSLTEKIKPGSY